MLRNAALAATAVAALAIVVIPAPPDAARADELTDVYGQILANPVSTELNLQYAMIAEGRGDYRKALAAYERVLVNDPGNESAKRGLQRIRRIIEPPVTQKTVEVGATYDTDPLHDANGSPGDFLGYGSFRVRDERPIGSHRWRTILGAYGEIHARESELNYANATAETGPLIDLDGTMMVFRPAVGAGAAYFDGRFYYWDVNASAGLEGYLQGAYQWVRLRTGYRQYDPSFTSDQGFYADLTGKLSFKDVFHDRDLFSIAPRLRWSGIEGDPPDNADEFAPGRYVEGGGTLEYAKVLSESLTAAINLKLNRRFFADIGGGSRQDLLLSPGVSVILTNVFGAQTDLRFDYRYQWNNSNQDAHDWQNHALTVAFVARR